MSITRRFILTLGGLLLGLLATLVCLHWFESRAYDRQKQLFQKEQSSFLKHWLNTDSQSMLEETRYLARDIEKKSKPALSLQLAQTNSRQSVWQLTPDGLLIDHNPGLLDPADAAFFTSSKFVRRALRQDGGWFYFKVSDELFQACFAPLKTSDKTSSGWLFLVRKWDTTLLQRLGSLLDGNISLQSSPTSSEQLHYQYQIHYALLDWRGQPLQTLSLSGILPRYTSDWVQATTPTLIFLGFGLLVILALSLGVYRWIITPLQHIKASLATEKVTPVVPYLKRTDEIGGIARLIEISSAQRDALRQSEANLQKALAQRIQLGRDLHDGVIQSLYATGMVLAGVRARVPADETATITILDQCRTTLNEIILDLRNFITGLEPEALKQHTFTHAVTNILNFAETGQKLKTKCEIDETLARQLTISQRANVLQITREALSNAIRHGHATEVSARLQINGSFAEFEFHDNGEGFVAEGGLKHTGHGLENLANRARDLGATFSVQSEPGQGTHLKLMFELPKLTYS